MKNVFFIIMRRMRVPLISLVSIYSIAILGLILINGVDEFGNPSEPMSIFHAFYFISYTATTIGFGELPQHFSEFQRLWVTVCIYLTVIGWFYTLVTIITLYQDKGFQYTLNINKLKRKVKNQEEPFYIICGYGQTGILIGQHFDRINQPFVVLEINELRVLDIDLQNYTSNIPALNADASTPDNLILAGLNHPKVHGVLAMTDNNEANLTIAITVRLLNPSIPVYGRTSCNETAANMDSFGTNHIINPFEEFAAQLSLAINNPERNSLIELLTGIPGSRIVKHRSPPKGKWILCSYGRFGQAVAKKLESCGIELTIVDPDHQEANQNIRGIGTEAHTLKQAGIEDAVGIIAGTDHDTNNLSIAVTASEIKPSLFVVIRQTQFTNNPLYDAYKPDFTMVPSQIIAKRTISIHTTPLLSRFIKLLDKKNEVSCNKIAKRIKKFSLKITPTVWSIRINNFEAPAISNYLKNNLQGCITTERILRTNIAQGKQHREDSIILAIERKGKILVFPNDELPVCLDDTLLFASTLKARSRLNLMFRNSNALAEAFELDIARGWLLRKLITSEAR